MHHKRKPKYKMPRYAYVPPKPAKKSKLPAYAAVVVLGAFYGWLFAGAPWLSAALRAW